MGGSAFSPELNTPRMPPTVYIHVRNRLHRILRSSFYLHVETPIEAPEKVDHGDVDILVAVPIRVGFTEEDLKREVGATTWKKTAGSSTTHFAIPWPEDIALSTDYLTDRLDKTTLSDPRKPLQHIQLDLHVCPTETRFRWELFQHTHGDFWNIVGGMIRRYGLTFSNSGLYIRIAELEAHNKKLARVLLTEQPEEVLDLLGLDKGRFWKPFESLDEMMDYAATCRFHNPARYQDAQDHDLQSNDRQKMKKRNIFRCWIEDYLPQHREDGVKGMWADMTRDEVVELVMERFPIREEFETRRKNEVRSIAIAQMWANIKQTLLRLKKDADAGQGVEVGHVMNGLKREIWAEAADKADQDLTDVQKAYMEEKYDEVADWAARNWKVVGERQREVERAKSHANLMDKLERTRVKGEAGPEVGAN